MKSSLAHVSSFFARVLGRLARIAGIVDVYSIRWHGFPSSIWHSPFARSVAVVAGGAAGAQAVTMAFAPLLTRIYGPEAFGHLGTFMAIVSAATPVAALAYPVAIILPQGDQDALGLVRLSVILSLGIASLVAVAIWLGASSFSLALGIEPLVDYLFLIPLAMLFAAWMQIAQQWLIRKKEFALIARATVYQSLILNSAKASIGWIHPIGSVLIALATFGNALQAALLLIGTRLRSQHTTSNASERARPSLWNLARKNVDFPLYRAPQDFINAASQSLPVLMLASFFGPAAAGFYVLAKMVTGMPATLLGKAVSDVFYPRITEAARNGERLPAHIIRPTAVLLMVGIVPFGFVMMFGPWLFGLAFGQEWAAAGDYARWLALFFLFNLINKPCVAAVPVLGVQRGLLLYEILSTGAKVAGLLVGFYCFKSDLWAVAMFSVIGVIAYGAMMLWIIMCSRRWGLNE